MCPSAAAAAANDTITVPTTEGAVPPEFQAVDSSAATKNGAAAANPQQRNPYASRASDFLSNVRPAPHSNRAQTSRCARPTFPLPHLPATLISPMLTRWVLVLPPDL